MALFKTCAVCGAHLDPGERCDCKEEAIMAYQGADEIEDLVSDIIRHDPRLSANGIISKLRNQYNYVMSPATAHKVIGRLKQFCGLRDEKSSTGATVYFFEKAV